MRETIHPFDTATSPDADQRTELIRYLNLKLAALGQPVSAATADPYFLELARPLLRNYLVKDQKMGGHLCPADQRIQTFLNKILRETSAGHVPNLPANTFVL